MTGEDAARELRALKLLEDALDRPTTERRAFVDRKTGADRRLRDEVLRLLDAAETEEDLEPFVADTARPPSGERHVGPYRLIKRVGAGGMGEVWRAERADGAFHREVAIKLLRPELVGEELLERFQRERQVQAALAHPGIAQLLDGGEDEGGAPYLVLEYVDGQPIDHHCRRAGLDDRARLALFLDVCAAVAHAHGRGIVHRDLKPSNILVGEDGRPRLLDFGIARVLDPALIAPGLDVTQGTFRMMTPAYASPEQLRLEPATPASDQYALGVLLYELLTERLPFQLEGRSPGEIERVVTDEEPTRPSLIRRGRPLAGDLDWIVLRALRKEPRRRYASVDDLADDVRRFLNGAPVRARPDTLHYRSAKFVRRYPVPVTLALLLFAALSAGIVVSVHQRNLADEAADKEALARADADRKREEAETVTRFLTDMIAEAAPGGAVDREATIRDALDAAARDLERRDWTGRAPLEARLRVEVGKAYFKLGAWTAAAPHLERAVAIVRAPDAPRDALWVAALHSRSELMKAELQFVDAEAIVRELLAFRDESGDSAARFEILNDLAGLVRIQGRLDEAHDLFVEAIAGLERFERTDALSSALNNLGVLETQRGRAAEGLPLFERALALAEEQLPSDDPIVLLYRTNLGWCLGTLVEFERSIPILRQAHDDRCRVLGAEHADTAHTRRILLLQLLRTGHREEASDLSTLNLNLSRLSLGSRSLRTADALELQGKIALNIHRDFERAWLSTVEAAEIRRELLPRHDPKIADLQFGLGLLLHQARDEERAVPLLSSALETPEANLDEANIFGPLTMTYSGTCIALKGYTEAAAIQEWRAERFAVAYGESDPRTIRAIQETGAILLKTRWNDVADERLRTAYERWRALEDPPAQEIRRCLAGLRNIAKHRDDPEATARWQGELDRWAAPESDAAGD